MGSASNTRSFLVIPRDEVYMTFGLVCHSLLNVSFTSKPYQKNGLQRKSGILKVFRCGPRRDGGSHEMAAHVDKPRKEEAAGGLDYPMGKVCLRLGHRLYQGCGRVCAGRLRRARARSMPSEPLHDLA